MPALLEGLHEARLGVPRRRARLVTLRLERRRRELLADLERRQPPLLVLLRRLVAVGGVREHEAGEGDHRAARAECRLGAVGRRRGELDRHGLPGRVLHLGRDRPLEDQVVQGELVAIELASELGGRPEDVAGRPDRLVRLLCVRDGSLVAPRLGRHGVGAVLARGVCARRLQRGVGERHRVGAHVRDVAVLVEPLREAHRRLGREAELAAGLLLQRRRSEGGGRPARVGLLVDLADGEGASLQARGKGAGALLVQHQHSSTLPRRSRRSRGPVRCACLRRRRAEPRRPPARRCRRRPSSSRRRTACARVRARPRGASRPTARAQRKGAA